MADPRSTKTNTSTIPTQEQWPLAKRLEIKGWEDCEFRALIAEKDDCILLISACLELPEPVFVERQKLLPDDLYFVRDTMKESEIYPLFRDLFSKTPQSEAPIFAGCSTVLDGAIVFAESAKFLVTKRSEEGEELREI